MKISLSKGGRTQEWFDTLPKDKQDAYLSTHPHSKYSNDAQTVKRREAAKKSALHTMNHLHDRKALALRQLMRHAKKIGQDYKTSTDPKLAEMRDSVRALDKKLNSALLKHKLHSDAKEHVEAVKASVKKAVDTHFKKRPIKLGTRTTK